MPYGTEFDDDLSDLIDGDAKAPVNRAPVDYKPITERAFTEPCSKCRGSGRFVGYTGRILGACFECKGTGKLTFKTSKDFRAQAKAQRDVRANAKRIEEQRDRDQQIEAFKTEHAEIYAWMTESAATFEFARSMQESLWRFGSLTENQMAACRKCLAGRERAKAERAQRESAAPTIEVSAIERAFAAATEARLKWPRLCLDSFTFKPAGPASKNAGSIYVTESDNYLGKITAGKFIATRDCGVDRQARILAAAADPFQAAKAYGMRTGQCGCCGRELTNGASIDLGIGPICAAKYGWWGE